MPRRVSLPGADELFRTTGGTTLTPVPRAPDGADDPPAAPAAQAAAVTPGAAGGPVSEQGRPADAAGEHGAAPAPSTVVQVPPARGESVRGETSRGEALRAETSRAEAVRAEAVRGDAQRGEASRAAAGGPSRSDETARPVSAATRAAQAASDAVAQPAAARRKARTPRSRPTGRERHEEKITVYVSAEELFDLEHSRLVLRGEYGLAVDRGRIVREAVAVVLADLEQRGEASILVRRLRGR